MSMSIEMQNSLIVLCRIGSGFGVMYLCFAQWFLKRKKVSNALTWLMRRLAFLSPFALFVTTIDDLPMTYQNLLSVFIAPSICTLIAIDIWVFVHLEFKEKQRDCHRLDVRFFKIVSGLHVYAGLFALLLFAMSTQTLTEAQGTLVLAHAAGSVFAAMTLQRYAAYIVAASLFDQRVTPFRIFAGT